MNIQIKLKDESPDVMINTQLFLKAALEIVQQAEALHEQEEFDQELMTLCDEYKYISIG